MSRWKGLLAKPPRKGADIEELGDEEWKNMSEAYYKRLEEKDTSLDEAADRINLLNLFVREGQQIHRLVSRKCCHRWRKNTEEAMIPDDNTCQGRMYRFCENPLFTIRNPFTLGTITYEFYFEHFILLAIGANCMCLALYDPLEKDESATRTVVLYWIEFTLLIVSVLTRNPIAQHCTSPYSLPSLSPGVHHRGHD